MVGCLCLLSCHVNAFAQSKKAEQGVPFLPAHHVGGAPSWNACKTWWWNSVRWGTICSLKFTASTWVSVKDFPDCERMKNTIGWRNFLNCASTCSPFCRTCRAHGTGNHWNASVISCRWFQQLPFLPSTPWAHAF